MLEVTEQRPINNEYVKGGFPVMAETTCKLAASTR